MVNKELLKYARAQVKKGHSTKRIKTHLAKHKWPKREINKAITISLQELAKYDEKHKKRKHVFITSFVVTLCIILTLLLIAGYKITYEEPQEVPQKFIQFETVPNQANVFEVEASNEGITISKLRLELNPNAIVDDDNIKMIHTPPATDFVLGGKYIIYPKDMVLQDLAKIYITYTDFAINDYKYRNLNLDISDLSLAYFDISDSKYKIIATVHDKESKTLMGEIPLFYEGGIAIVERSKIN